MSITYQFYGGFRDRPVRPLRQLSVGGFSDTNSSGQSIEAWLFWSIGEKSSTTVDEGLGFRSWILPPQNLLKVTNPDKILLYFRPNTVIVCLDRRASLFILRGLFIHNCHYDHQNG